MDDLLSEFLTETSRIRDARIQTDRACEMMFGGNSFECREVRKAFDAVGITAKASW